MSSRYDEMCRRAGNIYAKVEKHKPRTTDAIECGANTDTQELIEKMCVDMMSEPCQPARSRGASSV